MLFGICMRYAANQYEAEDWLQDGLIRIYTNLYRYRPIGAFGAWLRKVMVHSTLEQLRKRKRTFSSIPLTAVSEPCETDINLFARYQEEELVLMLNRLPEGYRTVFNLYVMEEYSHREIGAMLGIEESASRSQLFRAKALLRRIFENPTKSIIGGL